MRWRTLLMVVATSVAVAACGSSSSGNGGGDGGSKTSSILLYNGQHPELTQAEVAAFQHATGISVRLRTNDGVVLADQLVQEGGDSPADAYFTENSPELVRLSEKGLLARLPQSVLRQVPAPYRSPQGTWVGVALRVSALVYNPKLISRSQLPSSILDFAEPQWKGKVAIAPLDSDFPPVVGAVIATHGAKAAAHWVDALKQNAVVYQDDESVVAAVNAGNVPVGVINQYYWYRLRREVGANRIHSNLYYFPGGDPGSVVNISGAAVLASSQHRADAERFINFLVSQKGQKLITGGDDYEYPVRPGVAHNPQEPPLSQIAHTSISAQKLGNDVPASKMILNAGFGA
jgi:iron(III) transport system substrate-binding protein